MAKKENITKSRTKLKVGDTVMVIAGGSGQKRANKGQTGKLKSISGERAIVEGLNYVSKHKRQTSMQDKAAIVPVESPIHLSNLMYYAEKIKSPVRLKYKNLDDGRKVRGYLNPESKEFEQV